MQVLGYKYNTEKEALQVVESLNNYWGLPKHNGQSEFTIDMFSTWGGGYWCLENEYWYKPVLGNPYVFQVPDPPTTK